MTLALAAMSALPALRRVLVRRAMRFAEVDVTGVTLRIAQTPAEALAAGRLVHDAYVARGILAPHASGTRVTAHGILPTTRTIVAKLGDRVIGAISLVCDGPLGLPLEGTYRAGVEGFRAAGERLAEVGSLAIAEEHRSRGLVHLLYRYVFEVAQACGVTRLVIAVHPKAEPSYRGPLLFERFGEETSYPGLNKSARALPLAMSLDGIDERLHAIFGDDVDLGNPYHVYYARNWSNLAPICPASGAAQRAMAQALVKARYDVFEELSSTVLVAMRRALPGVALPYGKNTPMRETPSWWSSQFAPT